LIALGAIGGSAWWKRHKAPPAEQAAVETAPEADTAPAPAAPEAAPAGPAVATPAVTPDDEAMTNDHVLQMVEGKVSVNQIIAQIRASKTTQFVMTPAEVIRLSKGGVPDSVIEAMRNPKRAPSAPPVPVTPATAPKPTPQPEPAPQQPVAATQPVQPGAATMAKTLPAPSSPQPAAPKTPPAVGKIVPDGTGFKIILAEDIPDTADKDQALRFTVSEDLVVDGTVVIAKGTSVTGAVAEVPGKKVLGLIGGGKMTFKLTAVDAADGHKLNLRALPSRRTGGSFRDVDTGKSKPKGVAATAGTEYYAYIDGDQAGPARK
jgi:hypothetical protein